MRLLPVFLLLLFTACSTCRPVIGVRYSASTRIVDYPLKDSGAEAAGIRTGDKLIKIIEHDGYAEVIIERENKLLTFDKVGLSCISKLKDSNLYWGERL